MNRYNLWPFARGGEGNLAAATAVLLAAAVLNRVRNSAATKILLALVCSLWLLILYFFRDPERNTIEEDGLVVAPGDGEIMDIVVEEEVRYLGQEMLRVSIFLSVLDVHVQRIPISGRVILVDHQPGQFLQAFRPEASDVNEYIAMGIDSGRYGTILIKQIAGILARRCVNFQQVGDVVISGERFGLIRFSSRVDLFIPRAATLLVQIGDKVYGGLTPVARL